MKKLLCFLTLSAFVAGGSLFAQQQGGFVNPSQSGERGGFRQAGASDRLQNTTVAKVKELADDTFVSVVGFITEKLDDDKYQFKDAQSNDTIVIEIDDDKWNGLVVTPEDQVRIVGKVDKDDGKVEIEVRNIRKFNPAERGRGAEGRNMRNADDRGQRGERANRGSGRQGGEGRRGAPNRNTQ